MRITESRLRSIIRSVIRESSHVFPKDKEIHDMWYERDRNAGRLRKLHNSDLDRMYRQGETISFAKDMGLDDFDMHSIAGVYFENVSDNPSYKFKLEDFPEETHEFLTHYFELDLVDDIDLERLKDLVTVKFGLDEQSF